MEREDWDRRYGGTELIWTAEPNRFVVEELGDLPAGRALDLGAGEGRNAVWLAERGWRVTAVDFSPVALDKARRLARARGVSVDWALEGLPASAASRARRGARWRGRRPGPVRHAAGGRP